MKYYYAKRYHTSKKFVGESRPTKLPEGEGYDSEYEDENGEAHKLLGWLADGTRDGVWELGKNKVVVKPIAKKAYLCSDEIINKQHFYKTLYPNKINELFTFPLPGHTTNLRRVPVAFKPTQEQLDVIVNKNQAPPVHYFFIRDPSNLWCFSASEKIPRRIDITSHTLSQIYKQLNPQDPRLLTSEEVIILTHFNVFYTYRLILPLIPGKNLGIYQSSVDTPCKLAQLFLLISQALLVLHTQNLVMIDLKMDNIHFDNDTSECYLLDGGHAVHKGTAVSKTFACHTLAIMELRKKEYPYLAPEGCTLGCSIHGRVCIREIDSNYQ